MVFDSELQVIEHKIPSLLGVFWVICRAHGHPLSRDVAHWCVYRQRIQQELVVIVLIDELLESGDVLGGELLLTHRDTLASISSVSLRSMKSGIIGQERWITIKLCVCVTSKFLTR